MAIALAAATSNSALFAQPPQPNGDFARRFYAGPKKDLHRHNRPRNVRRSWVENFPDGLLFVPRRALPRRPTRLISAA